MDCLTSLILAGNILLSPISPQAVNPDQIKTTLQKTWDLFSQDCLEEKLIDWMIDQTPYFQNFSIQEKILLKRSLPYLSTIKELEKTIGHPGVLYKLCAVESSFCQNAVSSQGAVNLSQITPQGAEGLKKSVARAKYLVGSVLDAQLLAQTSVQDIASLENTSLKESFGYNVEKFRDIRAPYAQDEPFALSVQRLKYSILPQYLYFQELGFIGQDALEVDFAKIKKDPHYALRCAAAIFISNYYDLTPLQMIKTKKGTRFITRSPSFFERHPHLQAFDFADVVAAYNGGVNHVRECALQTKSYYPETRKYVQKFSSQKTPLPPNT